MTELAKIQSVREILSQNLTIPDYQRPYKWTERNVYQLLDDLWFHFAQHKHHYRIGSVVLHKDKDKDDFNIVDGQQRIITLSLILHHLKWDQCDTILDKLKIKHQVSLENIKKNSQIIADYFSSKIKDTEQESFRNYILSCEMVEICLTDIDEAFQFFDSQNARGKSLEPYDLLKAYHLREFKADKSTILQSVHNWEQAVDEQQSVNLNTVISKTLFRLRRWDKFKDAEVFKNEDIVTFKGVNQECSYPYVRQVLAGNAMYRNYLSNPFMFNMNFAQPTFQANQVIINGQSFFDYIEHYKKSYDFLFHRESGYLNKVGLISEKINFLNLLNTYSGHWRIGDQYVRNLFECVVLRYYDKFGLEELDRAINLCFKWAYRIRLMQTRVSFRTVEKEANNTEGLLFHINNATTPREVLSFTIEPYKVDFEKVGELLELINVSGASNV